MAVSSDTPRSWNGNSGIPPPLELAELVEVVLGVVVVVEVVVLEGELEVVVVVVVVVVTAWAFTITVPFIQLW